MKPIYHLSDTKTKLVQPGEQLDEHATAAERQQGVSLSLETQAEMCVFTEEAKSSDAGQNWFPQIKGELKAHRTYEARERGKTGPGDHAIFFPTERSLHIKRFMQNIKPETNNMGREKNIWKGPSHHTAGGGMDGVWEAAPASSARDFLHWKCTWQAVLKGAAEMKCHSCMAGQEC